MKEGVKHFLWVYINISLKHDNRNSKGIPSLLGLLPTPAIHSQYFYLSLSPSLSSTFSFLIYYSHHSANLVTCFSYIPSSYNSISLLFSTQLLKCTVFIEMYPLPNLMVNFRAHLSILLAAFATADLSPSSSLFKNVIQISKWFFK